MSPAKENGTSPQFTWRDLWKQGRFAIRRTWAASPSLVSGLALVELLTALVPVLFAVAAGLVIREAKYVLDGELGHQFTLALVLAGVVGLMLIETLATIGRRYVTSRLTDELRLHLSVDIARHLSSMDLAFFEDPGSQDVAERAGRQPGSDMVRFVVTTFKILTQGFQVASLAAVLIYIEPVFTPMVVLVSIPLLVFRWHMAKLTYSTARTQTTIRRWSGYKIFNRHKDCGIDGRTDRSRRPYRHANQLPFQIEKLIRHSFPRTKKHARWAIKSKV